MTRLPSLSSQVAGPEALPAPDTIYGEGPIGPTPPPFDPGVSTSKLRAAEFKNIQKLLGFPKDTAIPTPAEEPKPQVSPRTPEKPKVAKEADDHEIPEFLKREKPAPGEVIEPVAPAEEPAEKTIEQEMDSYRDKFNAFIKEEEAAKEAEDVRKDIETEIRATAKDIGFDLNDAEIDRTVGGSMRMAEVVLIEFVGTKGARLAITDDGTRWAISRWSIKGWFGEVFCRTRKALLRNLRERFSGRDPNRLYANRAEIETCFGFLDPKVVELVRALPEVHP